MVVALIFYKDDIPTPITATLDALAQVTLPLMMFQLGVILVWRDIGNIILPVLSLNIVKLIAAPLIGIFLAKLLLPTDAMAQGVVIIDSATPSIILCLAYANQYKLDEEFTSAAVFSSFFFCALTIPTLTLLFLPH
jgi:predicted permease